MTLLIWFYNKSSSAEEQTIPPTSSKSLLVVALLVHMHLSIHFLISVKGGIWNLTWVALNSWTNLEKKLSDTTMHFQMYTYWTTITECLLHARHGSRHQLYSSEKQNGPKLCVWEACINKSTKWGDEWVCYTLVMLWRKRSWTQVRLLVAQESGTERHVVGKRRDSFIEEAGNPGEKVDSCPKAPTSCCPSGNKRF